MSWIDTPLVQDAKADLSTFHEMLPQAARTAEEDHVGRQRAARPSSRASKDARRRIYCPGWVGVFRWLQPLLATPIGERDSEVRAGTAAQLDAEVAALGRYFSARTEALEKR